MKCNCALYSSVGYTALLYSLGVALGYRLQCLKRSPWGTRPHPIVCRPSVHVGLRGRWPNIFPRFLWEGPLLGTPKDINQWINHWSWSWSFCLHGDPVGGHGGGAIYRALWGKGAENSGDGRLSFQEPVGEPV